LLHANWNAASGRLSLSSRLYRDIETIGRPDSFRFRVTTNRETYVPQRPSPAQHYYETNLRKLSVSRCRGAVHFVSRGGSGSLSHVCRKQGIHIVAGILNGFGQISSKIDSAAGDIAEDLFAPGLLESVFLQVRILVGRRAIACKESRNRRLLRPDRSRKYNHKGVSNADQVTRE
jgi:hypothetical protein